MTSWRAKNKPRYDFRKKDGNWQRRPIHGGRWLTLHVETVTRYANGYTDGRRTLPTLAPLQVWTWK